MNENDLLREEIRLKFIRETYEFLCSSQFPILNKLNIIQQALSIKIDQLNSRSKINYNDASLNSKIEKELSIYKELYNNISDLMEKQNGIYHVRI